MKHARVILAGAVVGFLGVFSIWFVPEEPYRNFIVAAGIFNGALTALLITVFVDRGTSVAKSLGLGALVGFAMAVTVYLAKGGWVSNDAPFVVPTGIVQGLILGALVRVLNPPR